MPPIKWLFSKHAIFFGIRLSFFNLNKAIALHFGLIYRIIHSQP